MVRDFLYLGSGGAAMRRQSQLKQQHTAMQRAAHLAALKTQSNDGARIQTADRIRKLATMHKHLSRQDIARALQIDVDVVASVLDA